MQRRSIYLTALLLAGTMVSSQAIAQEVLMRRPLPTLKDSPSDPSDSQPPTQPTGRVVGYGWDSSCPPNPMWGCSRVTYENDDWNYEDVDGSLCQTQQSPEAINLAAYLGLIPGGPGVTQNQACSSPTMVYGWEAGCFDDGGMYKTCIGLERNSSIMYSVIADYSVCESSVTDAAGAAFLAQYGLISNAEYQANPISCGGGGGPSDPELPGGNDDNTGMENDPGANPNDPYPDGPGWFEWEVGPWQGGGQCGEPSMMTRSIRCVQHPYGEPEMPAIGAIDNGVVQVSFQGEKPQMSNAVWDPSQGAKMSYAIVGPDDVNAKMTQAQLGPAVPTGDPIYVNWESCRQSLGYTPANSYQGTEANCTYEKEKVSDGEWTLPSGAYGTPTCSADAERTPEFRCVKQETGEEVDPAFCAENLTTGGTQDVEMISVERGNYEGCTAEWEVSTSDVGCYATTNTNSGNGPVHMVESYANCIRSDGAYLEGVDAEACGQRPQEGLYQQGSCVQSFNQNVYNGYCPSHLPSPIHNEAGLGPWRTVVFPGSMYAGGRQACLDAGSTCCQERFDLNTGKTETVGSNQPIARLSDYYSVGTNERGVYMDDGNGPVVQYGSTTYHGDGTVTHDESTKYWIFEDMHRYTTQGGSGLIWVSPGVE